jgi:hypothetical protein
VRETIQSVVEFLGVLHSLKEKGKPSCSDFKVTQSWGTEKVRKSNRGLVTETTIM